MGEGKHSTNGRRVSSFQFLVLSRRFQEGNCHFSNFEKGQPVHRLFWFAWATTYPETLLKMSATEKESPDLAFEDFYLGFHLRP